GADSVVEARSGSVMNGYLNRPLGEGFTADGWWRTGDIGRFDEDGYLFLQGRASDLIITGGHNVQPAEVERVLASVFGVAEVAVAGVPDERWGQIVGAFVVAQPGVELARLLSELRSVADLELAPSQRPRQWRFLAELPRNALGKVTRSRLAVMSAE
ncbi:MAG: fatty acid--CoA ligase family protein, partial [Candidatus Nanopelagicales bacterium]|nr:fatty acid--CoA ligase family protein [Candidatus Nanopelagicales bacterium]